LITPDFGCIFLNRKTRLCAIYEDRPNICKAYGTTIANNYMIACPYFKPNGNPWSEAKRKQIDRIHQKQTDELMKEKNRNIYEV
jgi:Fe-S-cluster containining protein